MNKYKKNILKELTTDLELYYKDTGHEYLFNEMMDKINDKIEEIYEIANEDIAELVVQMNESINNITRTMSDCITDITYDYDLSTDEEKDIMEILSNSFNEYVLEPIEKKYAKKLDYIQHIRLLF